MDKNKIKQLCEQILMASDSIVSIGAMTTQMNAPQIAGIQRAAKLICVELDKECEGEQTKG